jgi:DNA replication ATP-dependent helicase Dna2
MGVLQEDLRQFVRKEHEVQRKALARVWAMPVDQRVEEGRCVTGGRLRSHKPPHGMVISFPANDSRFRDGDFVRLSRGDPENPICGAVVVRAEDEWIELEVRGQSPAALGLDAGISDLQIDEDALDLERFFLAAIEDLGKTETGRERILPLLAGERRPTMDLVTFETEHIKAATDGGFNEEQSKAVASALATDLCWLIHGPPGTGKTRVLSWIVRGLIERGERVLVTGANHRAINNLLEEIANLSGDMRGIFKVTPFRDPGSPVTQVRYFSDISKEETAGAFVIGATPFALRTRRLSGVDFDTVIIDEASQVSVALAVMAMLGGKRYILAGDHHQLPPVRLSLDSGPDDVVGSIFGRLVDRGMDTMLTITHRLNEPLCVWPSTTFYLSRLESSKTAAGRRLAVTNIPMEFEAVLAPEPASIWLAVDHVGSRTSSPEEVEAISQLLLALRAGGVAWEHVGVVVPFRRQARVLRQRMGRHLGQPLASFGLVADTVERMQGQEREVVIVTMAASEPMFVARVAGFLFQPQRLNVAATRARTKFILVASSELVDLARDLPEEIGGQFVSLVEHAIRIDY